MNTQLTSQAPAAPLALVPARERFRVVLIGGGTAGISVASRLRRHGVTDMAIIEPSRKHSYQPLWTLVGAGVARAEDSERDEADYIPKGVRWIQDRAEEVDPVAREVRTASGLRVGYDFLVVAPGIQLNWDKDASDLPTSRTGAAIRKQAPVLVDNLPTPLGSGVTCG